MSIINFQLNFQKYTLYMHLYKCIFNVHKKCEFYNGLYLDIIRLGFYIFMWLFYAYLYIYLFVKYTYMLCINMQKIPLLMSILKIKLNFLKIYTLYALVQMHF